MDVVAVYVRAPGDDHPGVREVLRSCAQLDAVDALERGTASRGADCPVKLGGTEAVKKTPVHRPITKLADGAGIAVRQDRLGPKLVGDRLQLTSNLVERFFPGDALKRGSLGTLREGSFSHSGATAHGIQQPIRRVDAVQVLRHLAAQETACHRMRGVTLDLDRALLAVRLRLHRYQNAAGVGAIERAYGVDCARLVHSLILVTSPCIMLAEFDPQRANALSHDVPGSNSACLLK